MVFPDPQSLERAAEALKGRRIMAFTGAGISVESGIAPFRGPGGLWSRIDPARFEIAAFHADPAGSWALIKELFFDTLGRAEPNAAHKALAELERADRVLGVVTQNIDGLHQAAGSRVVYEFHGNTRRLRCVSCDRTLGRDEADLSRLPPKCPSCKGLLKPDIIFFGEAIPAEAQAASMALAKFCDACLIVGSTGEVLPAAYVPQEARRHGAVIVEVNVAPSQFTGRITDVFVQAPAGAALSALARLLLD